MADRLKTLRRIEVVQEQMVRLTQWRVAAAEQACCMHAADRERLADFVSGESALGVPLAKAALKAINSVDRRLAQAEAERAVQAERLDALKRRGRVVATMVEKAKTVARREAEDRDLAATIEAWVARASARLP